MKNLDNFTETQEKLIEQTFDKYRIDLKKALESNKSFQGWNKAIGLSFDDFDIVELIKNDTKLLTHKKGKKDIGKYSIIIKNGVIDSFYFDMANETVRQNRLNFIASLKVS